jgi:hypothetical protein
MALGFRDCCNQFNYFFLSETPATVSEFETYYIQTIEGPYFCATYLNLPPLNYTPTTYNTVSITEQVSCDSCVSSNPCPVEENILENQFGPGSIIIQPDCNFTSIRYLNVECFPVNPTYENSLDGEVILFVNGGVPPYTFRNYNTGQVLQANPIIDNFYTVMTNVTAGDYRVVVSDTNENFIIDITCTLVAPPPFPVFSAVTTDASVFGKPDGQIDLIVLSAGTRPYTYIVNGIGFSELPIIVGAGTYVITVIDQFYTTTVTAIVGQPPPVNYPSELCFNVTAIVGQCSEQFGLKFFRFVNDYDYRAQYYADNPIVLGFNELNLKYVELFGGWVIVESDWNGSPQFTNACSVANISYPVGFRKLNGTTDTPDGLDWATTSLNFASPTVIAGVCTPSLRVLSTTNSCTDLISPTKGSVTLEATGGAGGPYKYSISPVGILTNNNIINLDPNSYIAQAEDRDKKISNRVSFTINSVTPFVFNLANLNQCLTYTQNSVFLNVVPGGGANQIEPGESRRTRITTTTNFNFSQLPEGFEITSRITITMDFQVTVSVTPYTDPRIYLSTNIDSTPITTSTITTNGVTSNFMDNINYVTSTYPNTLLGDGWYRIANGSTSCATGTGNCPLPLDVNGARYRKTVVWTSNLLTINNTTSVSLTYFNEFTNSIPIITSTTTGCYNGCGGGLVVSALNVTMLTPTKTKGCGSVTNGNRRLMYYSFNQHPKNGARFTGDILPSPLCP